MTSPLDVDPDKSVEILLLEAPSTKGTRPVVDQERLNKDSIWGPLGRWNVGKGEQSSGLNPQLADKRGYQTKPRTTTCT